MGNNGGLTCMHHSSKGVMRHVDCAIIKKANVIFAWRIFLGKIWEFYYYCKDT